VAGFYVAPGPTLANDWTAMTMTETDTITIRADEVRVTDLVLLDGEWRRITFVNGLTLGFGRRRWHAAPGDMVEVIRSL
jgi:hypothetical protein